MRNRKSDSAHQCAPHYNEWPDGAITPFRSEKNTNWEGAFRVPCAVRWPGRIQAGKVIAGIVGANDWMPTLLAVAGVPDIKEKLLQGHTAGNKTFKVHLDGYNQLPTPTGDTESPRQEFFYFDDDGKLVAARLGRWKANFTVQRAQGFQVWMEPFVHMRIPYIIDLKMDPFERRAPENSNRYYHWFIENAYLAGLFQPATARFLSSFRDFPPRQRPASFNVDQYMDMLTRAATGPAR